MSVVFTPQQDRNILYAIGLLVSSNQLLYLTTNQKPYADTSMLYKETSVLVTALALLLSSCKKATRNWRRIHLFGSKTGIAPKAWQTVLSRTLPWCSQYPIRRWQPFQQTWRTAGQVTALSLIKSQKTQSQTERMHNSQQTCNFASMQAQLSELQKMFCPLSESLNVNINSSFVFTSNVSVDLL